MQKQIKNKKKKIFSKDFPIGSFSWKYARMIEERRGHNYQYYQDGLAEKLERQGYKFWDFGGGSSCTRREEEIMSETLAKEIVIMLRDQGNYARIVVGREQNQQKIKMFSVIYRRRGPSA